MCNVNHLTESLASSVASDLLIRYQPTEADWLPSKPFLGTRKS
jgi:hypothetical protein